ncbi:MAG TPA: hypothetical protein VM933_11320 [Acidimicrobiales bacterium]|nr:hypothetical protein [Acidimicrobiales bacterium]
MGDLLDATMAWMDPWWDPGAGLLWNMEGAYDEVGPPRSIHLVPQSAWYAAGLLFRGLPGDEARAVRTIGALLDTQYASVPEAEWHGTFARFLEAPVPPRTGAVVWVDYDPNWRQFIGTVFELLLQDGLIADASLGARMRSSVALAVSSEPLDRVPPSYSNIALMRAFLEVEHDRPGAEAYAARVVELFDEHGAFEEYNSATYYGIDLYALALWRDRSSSPALRAAGGRIEAALWRDVARWYHPGLRNLCGPWSRSYGMDLSAYASLLGLWMWPAVGGPPAAPYPSLDAPFEHSHDTTHGPLADRLGPVVPADALGALTSFVGEHEVAQRITSTRVATGWLSDRVMCGGEDGDLRASARGQFHPATVHWALPSGGVGWIRLVHHAPARGVASPGRLDVRCLPSVKRGPVAPELWLSGAAAGSPLTGRRWALPGLDVEISVEPEAVLVDGGLVKVRFPVGTPALSLALADRSS